MKARFRNSPKPIGAPRGFYTNGETDVFGYVSVANVETKFTIILIMRKIFTLAAAMFLMLGLQAQQLSVGEAKVLKGTEKGGFYHAVFSPSGDYLLTSTEDYSGLNRHELQTGKQTRLSDAAGAGYGVRISQDGKQIVARRYEYQDNRRFTAIERINAKTGKTTVARRMAREQVAPVEETAEKVYVTTNGFEMTVHNGGQETVIRPCGNESYFWCSVSPDGNRVLYVTAHHGAQICNIDGSNAAYLGIMNAPQWIDNENVIGMIDRDNGDMITDSRLLVRNINTPEKVQVLATGQKIAMYPAVSADGKRIAFNNEKGQIFIMEVKQ